MGESLALSLTFADPLQDALDNVDAGDGLPTEQSDDRHVNANVRHPCPFAAALHQGGEGGGDGNQARHGKSGDQVWPDEEFAIIQISNGHGTDTANHHQSQDGRPNLVMFEIEFALEEGFFRVAGGTAGTSPLPSGVHRVQTHGQHDPH